MNSQDLAERAIDARERTLALVRDLDGALLLGPRLAIVWEWTATTFVPCPGFEADPYREYSAPRFGTHNVLRGGCFQTRARLLRNTWRNFNTPDRRDV
ncbi:MAG: SUMF1/EgtB/PvdO family nonheme iron enzyme [Polyangiales bacterium]